MRIATLYGPSSVSFLNMMQQDSLVNGRPIEYVMVRDPQQVQSMMMQHKVEFAVLPTVMAANLYNKGLSYQMLACPVWGSLYLLSCDKNYNLQSLPHESVGIAGQGATPDILFRHWMKQHAMPEAEINYRFSAPAELAQALIMKKVKIAVLSEPFVSNILSKHPECRIILRLNCYDSTNKNRNDIFVQTAFLVEKEFAESNKALCRSIEQKYQASCNKCNSDLETTAALMLAHQLADNTQTARRAIPLCQIKYVQASAITKQIEAYLSIFFQFNPQSVGNKIPDKNFICQP